MNGQLCRKAAVLGQTWGCNFLEGLITVAYKIWYLISPHLATLLS